MIGVVDDAMRSVQSALFAREHYGSEHPAVARAIAHAARRLAEAAGPDRRPIAVMRVADRVVALGGALPSSRDLHDGLFGRLADRGVTCLTFDPGVAPDELDALVAWLDAPGAPGWSGTTSIRPGAVGAGEEHDAPRPRHPDAPLDPDGQTASVRAIWTAASTGAADLADERGIRAVVGAICDAVTGSQAMVLPLAHLKRHDEYTFVHTTNVAILTASLAEAVGLRDAQILDLTTAALLHDVGKRSVPRAVLNKRGKLSSRELDLMRRHPVDGARILFASKGVPDIVPVVAFEHHIHLDGSGYPHVGPGWRISLASQIVQVADVYDALRTHRPYRKALPRQDAFDLMMRDAGVRFDRELLGLFFERVASRTDREAAPDMWSPARRAA